MIRALSGAPQSGAAGRPSIRSEAENFRRRNLFPPRIIKKKRAPTGPALWETNAQKPTFVNTVWGYGYKWGS